MGGEAGSRENISRGMPHHLRMSVECEKARIQSESELLVHDKSILEVYCRLYRVLELLKYAEEQHLAKNLLSEQNSSPASSVRVPEKLIRCLVSYMKLTNRLDVYNCVCGQGGEEIKLDENVRVKAKACIDTMLTMGE